MTLAPTHRTEAAARALFLENRGLALAYVSRLVRARPHLRPMEDDLIQEAQLGLLAAARKYDPTRGAFASYGWQGARIAVTKAIFLAGRRTQHFAQREIDVERFAAPLIGGDTRLGFPIDAAREELISRYRAARAGLKGGRGCAQRKDQAELAVECFLARLMREGDPAEPSLSEVGAEHGFSRERARQLAEQVRPLFEAWAAELREENEP